MKPAGDWDEHGAYTDVRNREGLLLGFFLR